MNSIDLLLHRLSELQDERRSILDKQKLMKNYMSKPQRYANRIRLKILHSEIENLKAKIQTHSDYEKMQHKK